MERQKELYFLSSFIAEEEEWLKNWVSALGWSMESLQQPMNHPELSQCPFNAHHYVPSSSLEEHKKKCQCAVLLGTDIHNLDMEELSLLNTNTSFLYKDSNIEGVIIGKSIEDAVKRLASDTQEMERLSRSHDHHVIHEQFSSLEQTQPSPPELHHQDLPQLISYIKSWKKVPSDFQRIDGSSLNLIKVKGWLFKNLPEKHAHSAALGGEITMVDSIMACLSPSSYLIKTKRVVTMMPNILMSKLQPLLGLNARPLVLGLWKFLHISRLQKEHGMSDSFVDEIVPMAPSVVEGMKTTSEDQEQLVPSIAELIAGLVKQEATPTGNTPPSVPLPPDHVIHQFTTSERRILYDYIVEVTSRQAFMKLDPDLYRDDMAVIKAKLKVQAKLESSSSVKEEKEEVDTRGKTYLQLLKEKRDYKRRRQKYRARNVHITRRTPTEIFRTIISNRMEELGLGDGGDDTLEKDGPTKEPSGVETPPEHLSKSRRERSRSPPVRERSRSNERGSRARKRDRSPRGREERRDHKRSRRSRERRSRSRKRGRRSQSREKSHKHKKHRNRL